MKKLLSLFTVMAFALPLLAAGTASDAYLNISKYATIDEAGATVDGMETIYKYTEVPGGYWLTLSNYGVMKTDATQNWFTNEVTDSDTGTQYTNPWTATDVFQGPAAYFGNNTAYSAKFKQPTKTQCFYVTFCTQVKQYAYSRSTSSYYLLKLEIYECTVNADGSVTPTSAPIETIQNTTSGAEVLTSSELDPEKVYMVKVSNSYSYLYEIGFKTPGLFDGEIVAPVAYDVTDLTTHPIYEGAEDIISEAFTCHWDPCQGAKSYTVRVYPSEDQEGLMYREKFTNCAAGDVYEDYENIDGTNNEGWTGCNIQGSNGGVVIDNNGSLYSPMTGIPIYRFVKKFTVKFKANAYGNDTDCKLRFANGNNEMIVDLDSEPKYYTMVIDREFPNYYSRLMSSYVFQNTSDSEDGASHRIEVSDFKVYFGDYSEPRNVHSPKYIRPAWSGDTTFVYNIPADSTSFRFGKYINEEGNEQIDMSIAIMDFAIYYYDVQAVYYDGQESEWSNQIPIIIKPWPENFFLEDDADDDPVVNPAIPGDVNGDGAVNTTDVTVLYNYLLSGDTEYLVNGDQDGDGSITTTDVTVVYNILLGGS